MGLPTWAIGVIINLFGSVGINFGTNLMKLSHNIRQEDERNAEREAMKLNFQENTNHEILCENCQRKKEGTVAVFNEAENKSLLVGGAGNIAGNPSSSSLVNTAENENKDIDKARPRVHFEFDKDNEENANCSFCNECGAQIITESSSNISIPKVQKKCFFNCIIEDTLYGTIRANVWKLGCLILVIGSLCTFASFAFAPQSMLAALGSAQFVSNVFFARFVLGETITFRIILATCIIILGQIIVIIFSAQETKAYNARRLVNLYSGAYLGYLVFLLFFCIILYYIYDYYRAREMAMVYPEYVRTRDGEIIPGSVYNCPKILHDFLMNIRLQEKEQEIRKAMFSKNVSTLSDSSNPQASSTHPELFKAMSSISVKAGDNFFYTSSSEILNNKPSKNKTCCWKTRFWCWNYTKNSNKIHPIEDYKEYTDKSDSRDPNGIIQNDYSFELCQICGDLIDNEALFDYSSEDSSGESFTGDIDSDFDDFEDKKDKKTNHHDHHDLKIKQGIQQRSFNNKMNDSFDEKDGYEFSGDTTLELLEMEPDGEYIHLALPPIQNSYFVMPVTYAMFSAIVGTFSVLQAKCLSELLSSTIQGDNQLRFVFTYFVLVVWALTTVFWLYRMNKALRLFEGVFIIPVLQVFWTFFAIVGGGLYFQEFQKYNSISLIMFIVGVLIVFLGVFLLSPSKRKIDDYEDELPNANINQCLVIQQQLHEERNNRLEGMDYCSCNSKINRKNGQIKRISSAKNRKKFLGDKKRKGVIGNNSNSNNYNTENYVNENQKGLKKDENLRIMDGKIQKSTEEINKTSIQREGVKSSILSPNDSDTQIDTNNTSNLSIETQTIEEKASPLQSSSSSTSTSFESELHNSNDDNKTKENAQDINNHDRHHYRSKSSIDRSDPPGEKNHRSRASLDMDKYGNLLERRHRERGRESFRERERRSSITLNMHFGDNVNVSSGERRGSILNGLSMPFVTADDMLDLHTKDSNRESRQSRDIGSDKEMENTRVRSSTKGSKSIDNENTLVAKLKKIYDLEQLQDPDHYIPSLSLGVTDFDITHKSSLEPTSPGSQNGDKNSSRSRASSEVVSESKNAISININTLETQDSIPVENHSNKLSNTESKDSTDNANKEKEDGNLNVAIDIITAEENTTEEQNI